MRLLFDTHALIWWLIGDNRLPIRCRRAIVDESNDKLVSAATAWEVTTKFRLGKLPEAEQLAENVVEALAGEGFEELTLTVDNAARAGWLPGPLRDPFDRMLIAQALARNLVLISNESLFDRYGVRRLW